MLRSPRLRFDMLLATLVAVPLGCYQSAGGYDDGGAADDTAATDDGAASDDASPADDVASTDDGSPPDDAAADDAGPTESGECRTSADCGGRDCVRVPDEPGGYWVCRAEPPPEATGCLGEWDQCCNSSECTERPDGGCYLGTVCAGPYIEQNVCRYDECTTAADCNASTYGVCLPRDVRGAARNECLYGTCRVAADCSAAPGGFCAPLDDPCCPGPTGFHCIYPGRCRSDADCTDGMSCVPDPAGGTRCDFAACPL
ncbi:MAG: hypothetical protein HY905_27175 [Deltaproteobacteria bacterium]|nr:hypothetical protein [Deltaproteobacteria bacterium]